MHRQAAPLVLVNCWDVATARILREIGSPAIATAGASISASFGFPDDESIGRDRMLDVVRTIATAVDVPVTADVQSGFGDSVAAAIKTAEGALDAGAIGINFEDGRHGGGTALHPAEVHAERISAIRRAADARGVPLWINARTDVYVSSNASEEAKFDEATARARLYVAAGADSIYFLGPRDESVIGRLVEATTAPVNVLAYPDAPPIAVLARLGVKRISFGPFPMRHAMAMFREAAEHALYDGTFP